MNKFKCREPYRAERTLLRLYYHFALFPIPCFAFEDATELTMMHRLKSNKDSSEHINQGQNLTL